MTDNGKICVIIPVYKVEKYLARCIDSILAQTYTNYDVILVDDGSPDNCPEMCDEYAGKYSFIHVIHKENGGQGQARNLALDWAFSNLDFTYIAFIDSDDFVHNRFFEVLLNVCVDYDVDISCCGYVIDGSFDSGDNVKTEINSANNLCVFQSHDKFNLGVPWGRLFKKELFRYLRYPEDRYFEDGFTIFRALFSVEKIALVDAKLYCWFRHPDSTIQLKTTPKKINDYIDAMIETISFLRENGFDKAYRQEVNTFFYRLSCHEKNHGKEKALKKVNKKFREEAKKIIKSDRKTYNYYDYSDVYDLVFLTLARTIYKFIDKFQIKNKT